MKTVISADSGLLATGGRAERVEYPLGGSAYSAACALASVAAQLPRKPIASADGLPGSTV